MKKSYFLIALIALFTSLYSALTLAKMLSLYDQPKADARCIDLP